MWDILLFSLFFIFSQLSPGPDLTLVLRASLAQGFRAGCAVGLGCGTGITVHAVLVCTLGAALLNWTYAPYVCTAAGGWLSYLAWKVFPRQRMENETPDESENTRASLVKHFRDGLVSNLLNPKVTFYLLALATPLLQRHGEVWFPWGLGAAMVISCMAGWALWAALLQIPALRSYYVRHTHGVDLIFSILLGVFAIICFISAFTWTPSIPNHS